MDTNIELWRSLETLGYRGFSISSEGRLRNDYSGKILDGSLKETGYRSIRLLDENNQYQSEYIHRLILLVFVGSPSDPK